MGVTTREVLPPEPYPGWESRREKEMNHLDVGNAEDPLPLKTFEKSGLHRWVRRLTGQGGAFSFVGEAYRNPRVVEIPWYFTSPRKALIKVLHLSDLHLDLDSEMVHRVVRKILLLDFDFCVITGDFRNEIKGPFIVPEGSLEALVHAAGRKVFAVPGNHDDSTLFPVLEDAGISLLLNSSLTMDVHGINLRLAGVDDPHHYQSDRIESAVPDVQDDDFCLLLAHSPEIVLRMSNRRPDLILCGHTHGGQVCLPGGIPLIHNARCPRRFNRGRWKAGEVQGYTSRGTGACMIPVRLFCPGEITLHHFHFGG